MAWKRGVLVGTSIAAVAVACVDHLDEPPGKLAERTRQTRSDAGALKPGPCHPPFDDTTAGKCYAPGVTAETANEKTGWECLALRSYTRETTDRIQYRQTWSRSVAPPGNAIDLIYQVLMFRGQIPLSECNMPTAQSGYILLTDWDRSNREDKTQQTVRTGFANFVAADNIDFVLNEGMLFTEFMYSDPAHGLPEPGWHARPVLARRVLAEFEVPKDPSPDSQAKLKALRESIPEGEGIVFIDEDAGTFHGYSPLAWVVVFEPPQPGASPKLIAIPIRDAETRSKINNPDFPNCQGRYRGDVLLPEDNCASTTPQDPPWGCMFDEQRDDPNDTDVNPETGACPAGFGPNKTQGHFRIVDLEKVFNLTLRMTLCVSYMGSPEAIAAGWANEADTEKTCSASSKWNPSDPVNGLPPGDWCTATNSPATPDCHDSWLSVSFSASQAFPVYTGDPCAPDGYLPPPGSNIKSCSEVQNR